MIVIMGVGNEMMGDDAFGPIVAKKLEGKVNAKVFFGQNPENYIGKLKEKIEKLIILDTAYMNREPGFVDMLEPEAISSKSISTHKIPISLLVKQLEPGIIYFIAAEPNKIEFGAEPSPEIKEAAEKAEKMVMDILG